MPRSPTIVSRPSGSDSMKSVRAASATAWVDLPVTGVRLGDHDIVAKTFVKEVRVLGDKREMMAQFVEVVVAQVVPQ